jgi:hypothetical protein
MSSDEIDVLLERYLGLLDEYTTLRDDLSTLQAQVRGKIYAAAYL